jgi:hypothetical protein
MPIEKYGMTTATKQAIPPNVHIIPGDVAESIYKKFQVPITERLTMEIEKSGSSPKDPTGNQVQSASRSMRWY